MSSILSQISALNLNIAPKIYFTLTLSQLSTIDSISSSESVISGNMGSIFTPQDTPASVNFFIAEKRESAGGVPGSISRLVFSLHVVIDQTKKQLSLYLLCSSRSLDIRLDLVNI